MYVPVPYREMSDKEHKDMLEDKLMKFMNYVDGDSFKLLLLGEEDDYLLQLINKLRLEGKLNG